MNPEPIQFIYFDLDDTLLDHRQAERRGLADVRRAHPTHFGPIPLDTLHATYHAHSVPLWRQYADGEIGKHDLQRLRFERTLHALGLNGLEAEALNALYLAFLAPEPLHLAHGHALDKLGGFDEVRMALMGVRSAYQGHAFDVISVLATMDNGPALGYYACEMSWILDSNHTLLNLMPSIGAVVDKEYALFEKQW